MKQVADWRNLLSGAKISSGTNTTTLTTGLSLSAYAQGMLFSIEQGVTNTGAVTINVDSLGAKAIVKNYNVPLVANDLIAGGIYIIAYEATVGNFQLLSPGSRQQATLVGAETLTNKTLTSPVLNTGVSGSAFLDEDNLASASSTKLASQQSIKAYADALKSTSETLTNKTLTSPVLNTGVSGSAFLDEDNLASASSTKLASQQSIKAYADGLKSVEDTLTNKTLTAAILNGVTTHGGDVVSDTDSTDSLGTTSVRWLNVWVDKINDILSPTAQYTSAEETKLSGIEASADVTDATNVTAAGALMDSELTNIAAVKAINQSLVTSANPTFGNLAATNLDGILGASTARAGTFAAVTGTVIEATTSLELATGATVTGFDATASLGTSNTLVPTQGAVKTYVDNASAASAIWTDVVYLTVSNSPYSPSASLNGRFYAVDTSGGAVTINLPQISAAGNGWAIGIKKTTSDTNAITCVRYSGDEIDEIAGNVTIGVHNSGRIFLADTGATPDSWTTQQFGAVGGNMTVQNYTASTNFTAGSTTHLDVSSAPASEQNIVVTFDGISQHHDTYALSGNRVTFSSAIPTGTANVEIRWGGILAINVPGDGTVGTAQLAAGPAKDLNALAVTNSIMYVGDGSNIVAESGATLRTSIGVGTGDSPQVTGVELGHATDTTITRASAGLLAVEGVNLASQTGANAAKQVIAIACGDETSDTEAATAVVTFHMPYAFTLTGVKAGVTTAPVGSVLRVDINEAGATVLTTKITIDAGEQTSGTAATAPVIGGAGPALADNAKMTIDVDDVGSSTAGAGLKVYLIGYAT